MNVTEKIAALRKEMLQEQIDYYVVPSADYHQSEYVGDHFKARSFITGFTGSAGTALITLKAAYLWTDGRYFIQAAKQLEGTEIQLMKMGEPGVPTIEEFLDTALGQGENIGFDGRTVSYGEGKKYQEIAEKKGGKVIVTKDLIDRIWENRPELSTKPAFFLAECYTGESIESKLGRIREEMTKVGADTHILTTLDDICWTLNFRGHDITYFPLVLSYAMITMDEVILYMDENKADEEMKLQFAKNQVKIHPYNDIYRDVTALQKGCKLLLDTTKVNFALFDQIPDHVELIDERNPEILMKAIKNEVEIANIKEAQLKDSVAHVRFMKWLKENVGKTRITEMSASEKLDSFRAELPHFLEPSFGPICSFGEHAAIVHYSSTPETDVELQEGGLFLTDTGAGFLEGSTDVTRTYAFGEIPQVMKEHYTLVAISNLNLADAKFMKGSTGMVLDILARQPFWDRNMNYNHGTGHGVGYLMNIHEGPAGFRWTYRKSESEVLTSGMILTDEPGIYIEGSHGVRLENEVLVREGEKNEYGQFMYLETITLIPFDLDAIDPSIMSEKELERLNAYHKKVFEALKDRLTDEEVIWLKNATRALSK